MKLKRKTIIIIVVVITIIILVYGYLLLTNKSNNEIIGFWTIDDYTNYEFLENDKGNLVLPHKKMEFTYKIKDNTICIDFKDENAIDKCYEYKFEGKELIIKDSNNNVFNLKKKINKFNKQYPTAYFLYKR